MRRKTAVTVSLPGSVNCRRLRPVQLSTSCRSHVVTKYEAVLRFCLPPGQRWLKLATWSDEDWQEGLSQGDIHPEMRRKDAVLLPSIYEDQRRLPEVEILTPEETELYCLNCDQVVDEDEAAAIRHYECGECGNTFTSEDGGGNGNICPDCNKFSSCRDGDFCPECGEELDLRSVTDEPEVIDAEVVEDSERINREIRAAEHPITISTAPKPPAPRTSADLLEIISIGICAVRDADRYLKCVRRLPDLTDGERRQYSEGVNTILAKWKEVQAKLIDGLVPELDPAA